MTTTEFCGWPGRCTTCNRRRDVRTVQRYGGGTYRRPGRWYRTSVCEECATRGLDYIDSVIADGRHPGDKVHMLSVDDLRHILNRPRPKDTP